jgi:hypothetical protein
MRAIAVSANGGYNQQFELIDYEKQLIYGVQTPEFLSLRTD